MINPETNEPLVDFPTHFLFKVTGKNADDFETMVLDLLKQVDPEVHADKIKRTMSKSDKFISLSVDVWVKEQADIDKVYELLKSEPRVLWAL